MNRRSSDLNDNLPIAAIIVGTLSILIGIFALFLIGIPFLAFITWWGRFWGVS